MNTTDSNSKKIGFFSFFWNAGYAGLAALQSALLLFVAARTLEQTDAGIITIGFTIANLLMIVAIYGMRNYQVTDTNENFSFTDYFYCRLFSVPVSLLAAIIFTVVMTFLGKYSPYKTVIIIEITALKLVDAFENLYVGRLQQKGRLDIGSRIATIRLGVSTVVIGVAMILTHSCPISFAVGLVVSVILDVLMLPSCKKYADIKLRAIDKIQTKKLIKLGITLCVGTALHNYIGNAPKYIVDIFISDDILQAKIGYVMLPMFVITLLNTFIMQPAIKSLGDVWNSGDYRKFRKMILRHTVIILALSLVVLIAGVFIGLPLLTVLYKMDLSEYKAVFCLLFAGGAVYTLSAYFLVLLTTVRKQKIIVAGCVVTVLIYAIFGKIFLNAMDVLGVAVLYIIANLILLGIFSLGLFKNKSRSAA